MDGVVLQKKYTRAREVQHKVDKQIVSRDTSLVEKLVRTAIEVNISMTNINISLHEARQAVHDINEEMFNRAEFHKYALLVKPNLFSNQCRTRDVKRLSQPMNSLVELAQISSGHFTLGKTVNYLILVLQVVPKW